ncbi:hypothetical protein N8822_01075 [Candidatus Pelagibacter ubique]|nr:hypothetical protein [Candidatus Pelagibacter ubique]
MKKIILCYFLPFSLLKELKTSPYMNVLINISKKFESIFLVNTENLISTKIKTKKFYRIHKNFININPKNYTDLNKFTAKKKIIVINSIPRNLEHFRLLLYLTFKKIPKLEISNLGNIQKGTEVFIGKFNIKYFKLLITKYIPRKIIHLAYPEKFYAKYLPGNTIYKYRTTEFIKKSFIVLTFNSSTIVDAIKYDKRVISIQSKIFKGKKYSSSIYQELLKTKKITLSNKYNFNPRKLIIELDKKIKNYKNYKTNYLGFNQKRKSSDIIFKYIMEKYN